MSNQSASLWTFLLLGGVLAAVTAYQLHIKALNKASGCYDRKTDRASLWFFVGVCGGVSAVCFYLAVTAFFGTPN
jgi:hypothetical protein